MVGVSAGESEAPFAPYARELRREAPDGALVVLTGGLRSLPVIAELLDEGCADMFGLSRPFIAEPDLVNRWAEDDARPSAAYHATPASRPPRARPRQLPRHARQGRGRVGAALARGCCETKTSLTEVRAQARPPFFRAAARFAPPPRVRAGGVLRFSPRT